MRSLLATAVIALSGAGAGLGLASCGRTGTLASTRSAREASAGAHAKRAVDTSPALSGLRGDEDDDENPASHAVGVRDPDADADVYDDRAERHRGYYDEDDASIRSYGHPAATADGRTLTALAERYYRAV